jgi:hypothetical protein
MAGKKSINHPWLITGYQKQGTLGSNISFDTEGSSQRIKAIYIQARVSNSSKVLFGSSDISSSLAKGMNAGNIMYIEPGPHIAPTRLQDFYMKAIGNSSDGVDFYAIKA